MGEQEKIYEFFKNHIKMALYGMRCDIWNNLELPVDDQDAIKAELKDVVTEAKKVDVIIADVINKVSNVEVPATTVFDMDQFDAFRRSIDALITESRNAVDAIMTSEIVSKRLFEVAMRRRQEAERAQRIEATKQAINPANLVGTPASLNGADTVKIEKKEDGTAEVKPVTEG